MKDRNSKEAVNKDIEFLAELKERADKAMNITGKYAGQSDLGSAEYVMQMICDWERELKKHAANIVAVDGDVRVEQLHALGFVEQRHYFHDKWVTYVWAKGLLRVEMTYRLGKNKNVGGLEDCLLYVTDMDELKLNGSILAEIVPVFAKLDEFNRGKK